MAVARSTISIDPLIFTNGLKRAKALEYKSFSAYCEHLIRQDLESRPAHVMVREESISKKRLPETAAPLALDYGPAPGRERKAMARVTTDRQGRITAINAAFTEMCGFGERRLLGEKPGDVLRPETMKEEEPIIAEFRKAIREGRGFECTLTNYHANGSAYQVHIKMRPVHRKGKLVGFRAVEEKV